MRLPLLVLTVVLSATLPSQAWTAIASSAQGYAIVTGEGSAADAERLAKFDCPGMSCAASSFEDGCVAVARPLGGGSFHISVRSSLTDALEEAFEGCRAVSRRCYIERAQCEYIP